MAILINDLMLVHITDVRPSLCDGRLVMKTGGSNISLEYRDDKIFIRKRDFSHPYRVTIHWSINGVTRIAGFTQGDTTTYAIPARYAIIEPISALKDELWGGGFDDLYSLGDHVISKGAFVCVPEDEPDVEQLLAVTNVVHYRGYVEGFTNNHMRDMIASVLATLEKPRVIINGVFLNDEVLSKLWNITFPSRWASLTEEQLMEDEEFQRYNKWIMKSHITGMFRNGDIRVYVCKEAGGELPTGALFQRDDNSYIPISGKELHKILKDASYVLPEFGIIHPDSVLSSYEEKLRRSVGGDDLSHIMDEVQSSSWKRNRQLHLWMD